MSTTIIYRKSDKLVVGSVTPPHSVYVEIDNITKSELGGAEEDYDVATIEEIPAGHIVEVNPSGIAITKPNPKIEAKKQNRASAMTKFRALGLTEEEVKSLR